MDMFNTFYNATIAYQKYRPYEKDRNILDFCDFISDSGIYINQYYGK